MAINKAKDFDQYLHNYNFSLQDPQTFWAAEAEKLSWTKKFTKVKSSSFSLNDHHIKWFEDGELNVSYNCLDRHLNKNKTAIIWQDNDPKIYKKITYDELHKQVCKLANALKKLGVKKGDRVIIYLPMIPEAAISMLACARIGAIHSVVFGGFSSEAIATRISDCQPKLVITADGTYRGNKLIEIKRNVDEAYKITGTIKTLVVNHLGTKLTLNREEFDYHNLVNESKELCTPESMNAEDPLFILYTSGSTGKPKGVLHTSGGYLLYASMTHRHIFDLEENDIYWCTADIGWITGHSYVVYGPLCNGATTLMFEGIPTWPNQSRFWEIIEKFKVSIFYTAPTALRSLLKFGDDHVLKHDLSSLRMLGSVGEPIDPKTWQWFYDIVGQKKCKIADTWWQTETGGILISPLPVTKAKPGSATLPFYGIKPKVLENSALVIEDSWPGMLRNLYNARERFLDSYFSDYPNYYYSGDGAYQDEDGYFWITGRIDDILKVSGHRIGSAEIESVLVKHPQVAESAIVGYPHEIKGQSIFAYIVLKENYLPSEQLKSDLINLVRDSIGHIATIEKLVWVDQLPKTRSGKVIRRILRKIASDIYDDLGDITTLTDSKVIDNIISIVKEL